MPDAREEILGELVARARRHPHHDTLPFLSRVAAHQYDPLHAALERHVPAGARVLDWGAGCGHFSLYLARRGYRPVPYSIQPIDDAAWLPGDALKLLRGDANGPERIPFEDRSFDAVASVGVLEHVREHGGREEDSLAEIVRVLRPGGVFLCAHFPCRHSWLEALARRVPDKDCHVYRYGPADVRRLWGGAGLEVLSIQRHGFLPRNVWRRLPPALCDARAAVLAWNALDRLLSALAPPLCAQMMIVARRP